MGVETDSRHVEYKIIDTNVCLHGGAKVISAFKPKKPDKTNYLIIPLVVFNEIDNFKRDMGTLGKNARDFANSVKYFSKKNGGSLFSGVKLADNYFLKSIKGYDGKLDKEFQGILNKEKADTVVFKIALDLHRQNKKVSLVTHDTILGNIADACGVTVEEWMDFNALTDYSSIYKGRRILSVQDGIIDAFYQNDSLSIDDLVYLENGELKPYVDKITLFANEYFFLRSLDNPKKTALARYQKNKQALVKLHFLTEGKVANITCKNYEQKFAMDALLNQNISLIHLIGPAGTGKTLLALAAGWNGVQNKCYEQIYVSKAIVPSGRDLGYLPGSKEEKLQHWLAPVWDNLPLAFGCNKKDIEEFKKSGIIEVEASAYLRGRSLPNSFLLFDEVQNHTPDEVKTVATRIGEGSKLVFTGDPSQIDNPYLSDINNGLSHSNERMKGQDFVATVYMETCERSKLAEIASKLL